MRMPARILRSLGAVIALLPSLMSCGGGDDEPAAPEDVGAAGLFAQEKVLRNDRSLVASMPSRPGVTYVWSVVNGSASAAILEGAGTNVVRLATGESVGAFTLKATATTADGRATVSSRTLQVVQDWLLDSTNPLPRQDHSATLLDDGRVLVAGGIMGFGSGAPNPSAQIYDPETNTWGSARPMPTPRSDYTATRLANGDVLVAGGLLGNVSSTPSAAVEIYDSESRQWRAAAPMRSTRRAHTATLLADGRVLVAGGTNAAGIGGGPLASAEIYDPVADRWSDAGGLMAPRERHIAVRLNNGKVLAFGGVDESQRPGLILASAELYDPATNTWSRTGDMAFGRWLHAAALLADGRVIVAGGSDQGWAMPVAAEAYDPATGLWSGAGSLNSPRVNHTLSLLPDGRLLATGGTFTPAFDGQAGAEVYDPATTLWSPVGSMAEGRARHTATTLNNGLVLVVGGVDDVAPLASAERYSPAGNQWSSAGRNNALIASAHSATLLQDGTVLQAGGEAGETLRRAARYDPAANAWEDTGPLIEARFGHTATLLVTGEVLVAGGETSRLASDPHLRTAELYDPATRRWRAAASMGVRRGGHTATALADGRVLVAGGGEDDNLTVASAELYDRAADSWAPAGALAAARHGHTATRLLDGRVLVAGGEALDVLASAEIYDVAANAWQGAAPMSTRRWGHTATRLPNGKVLVIGGYGAGQVPVATAEVYDPVAGTWADTGAMSIGRVFHTATLLPDGTVMVTGGLDRNFAQPPLASTEIYHPDTGTWSARGPLNFARVRHTATLLGDGRIVVLGGGGTYHVAGGVEFWR